MDGQLTRKHGAAAATLLLVLYMVYKYRNLRKWQKEASKLCAGPNCHPLMGNIQEMIDAGGFSEELFKNLHEQHGDAVRFFMGPSIMNFSFNNPDMIHELYRKLRERPKETYLFLWYLGKENLLFQNGDMAKQMRLRYGEMVTQRAQLEKVHAVTFSTFSEKLDQWAGSNTYESTHVNSIDLHSELGPVIYDIMGQVLFNAPWLATEHGKKIYALHKKLIEGTNRWVLWPVGPIFHPAFVDYLLTIRKWRNMVGNLIDERAKDMQANPAKYENDNSAIPMLLTSKNEDGTPFFSRERAISTMCGFLNGAYDTTHATTYWMFWQMAKNPEVQTKLYEEFQTKIGNKVPDVDDIRKCDYLHAFIMESMRMRATVVVNQRVNHEEDVMIGDILVPKGTNVNIPNCIYHMDERWFGAETDKFRPERFLGDSPEAEKARKAFVGFGEFTRMCIGQVFALVELKAMVYLIITRCHVEMVNPADTGVTMLEAGVCQPSNHEQFVIRKRDMRRVKEVDNLKWWMQQIEALETIRPDSGTIAQRA